GAHPRDHLGHVGVDVRLPEGVRYGDAVMTVADEADLADPQHVDRWHRLPPPHRGGDLLPATPHPGGGGTEAAVEVAGPIHRADDQLERDHLQPDSALADEPERLDHLLV